MRHIGFHYIYVNTLRPRQDGRYFADDVFADNIPALVQMMDWRRPGDKPLSDPMFVFVPTHICVTRRQ